MPHDKNGHEIPDPTPVAVPVGWSAPESLVDQVRRLVRQEFSQQARATGHETFEEADDFDVDDDFDPSSPWELNFDQEAASRTDDSPAARSEAEPRGGSQPAPQGRDPGGAGPGPTDAPVGDLGTGAPAGPQRT